MQIDLSLQSELGPNERLLWSGKPRGGIRFRSSDLFMVPFSLLWGGFAIFWESTALFGTASSKQPPLLIFPLFGIPFVLVGLYMIVGRFFGDMLQRERTTYGLTNERIIIRSGLFNKTIKSLNLDTLSDVSLSEKGDRSGTITFGPQYPFAGLYTGMQWSSSRLSPAFDMIESAKDVYERIRAAQKDARRKDGGG